MTVYIEKPAVNLREELASLRNPGDYTDNVTAADIALMVESDVTGVTGADAITNIISLTQAEYDAITPDAATVYLITDA